jgi:hypothetical protein
MMSDTAQPGDLASLEPLEPLDTGIATGLAPESDAAMLQALRSGLPAPAHNPYCRDKTFYRFLFAGVILLVACILPYSADPTRPYYLTMSGGLCLLLGIALVWSWWASINNNRPLGVKWVMFAVAPLVAGLWNLMAFDPVAALELAKQRGFVPGDAAISDGWKSAFGDMFGGFFKRNSESLGRAEMFWRVLGTSNFFLFLGGLIAVMGFLGGLLGGAKQNKAEQKQKQMAAAERKRK